MTTLRHDPAALCDGVPIHQGGQCGPACHYPRLAAVKERPRAQALPCINLGEDTGNTSECASCSGTVRVKHFSCDVHGQCTVAKPIDGVACCKGCKQSEYAAPSRVVDLDMGTPPTKGGTINASILRHRGRLLMAYRVGWAVSEVYLTELGPDLQPIGPRVFVAGLGIPDYSDWGRDDPRLFVHDDALHLVYAGVSIDGGRQQTNICLARLRDDWTVERAWYADYSLRQWPMEKNWSPFVWDGELLAVYSVEPHTILHLAGDKALPFSVAPWRPKWPGGVLRGGAPPVRIGDEYWHWFHGVIRPGTGRKAYSIGLYTFEGKPPFRPLRYTPAPLVKASYAPHGSVVFPAGAVLDGDTWRVSAGVQDRSIAIYEFDRRDVERSMIKVSRGT